MKIGDKVKVIQSGGSLGPTTFEIVKLGDEDHPTHCMIREVGTTYAAQDFDISCLKKVRQKYETVNGRWPVGYTDYKPTPQEAVTAAKRLYRFALKRKWRGKVELTSGRNHTWIRGSTLYVNPDQCGQGFHEIVHGLSHCCTYRLHPGAKNHGPQHAFLEREMVDYAVKHGWLKGKLKRVSKEKPARDRKQVKQERVQERLEAWLAKKKRAENAIKKLRRQAAYYDRVQPA